MIAPLSRSYPDARAAFLDAAEAAEARLRSFPHPLTGLDGEALFVDVAEVGPVDADHVVIVVSGTHGVEGYLGSALQRHHLETLDTLDTGGEGGPAIVFVHALNPHGFSWVRRVNEDNVVLNRNFIDWSQPTPTDRGYGAIAELLVPGDWSAQTQERSMLGLMARMEEVGMERFQEAVSSGQYDHPTGLFYGGTGPTWSNDWLRSFAAERLEGVTRAAIVDLHTGLGPWGHGELISTEPLGSEALARQQAWWGDVISMMDDASVSAALSGDWLGAASGFAPNTEITSIAIEYGTVDLITVLQSLRADAVLHGHLDPTAHEAIEVRDQVRAAFLDDDPAWLQTCLPRYRAVVTAAVEQLA